MQFLKYLRYFFYLASNWNPRIATHIILHDVKGEKKYGIDTTGADDLQTLEKKGIDITHATIYMPASYDLLEDAFSQLPMRSFRHFIDIGCGKGRALCVAAHFSVSKLTGIDFSKEFCLAAKHNLEKTRQIIPALAYQVYNNDAFYFEIPDDVDCIFMFNPFDEVIMSGVVQNIAASMERAPRKLTVVYANPLEKQLLLNDGFKQVYHCQRLTYLEVVVLTKNPGS